MQWNARDAALVMAKALGASGKDAEKLRDFFEIHLDIAREAGVAEEQDRQRGFLDQVETFATFQLRSLEEVHASLRKGLVRSVRGEYE